MDRYQSVFSQFESISEEVNKKKRLYSKVCLLRKNNKEVLRLYVELFDLMRKFLRYYRYTEPHYLVFLEDKIDSYLKQKEINNERREYLKVELLNGNKKLVSQHSDIKKPLEFLRTVSQQRFKAKQNSLITSDYADSLLTETARRSFLAVTQASSLKYQELKELLLNNRQPEVNEINVRKKSFFLKIENSKIKHITPKAAIDYKKLTILASNKETILHGSTAYPGKVVGKAVVLPAVSTREEYKNFINKFKKGSILVAPMTSPDLVPIFKDVSAIVTDEGGITSHAAMIAREMKIPCIVGTSFATKVIKNGMRLSVDATNAKISMIKK